MTTMRSLLVARRFTIVAAILSLVAVTAGSALGQSGSRTLTVTIPFEPPHLDPVESLDVQQDLNYHLYRNLYRFTPDMTPHPDLVVADKVTDEGRTWTLELRKNVVFHDGTPFNAAAVKYTIERMKDPKRAAPMAVLFAPITSVRVVDDHTIELQTKEPFASLRNNLAHVNTGMISPTADQARGKEFGRKPVSAGAYELAEWVSGDRIVLKRFDRYVGARPYYDTIVFRIVPDAQTRLVMLERGEADVAIRMPATQADLAEGNRQLQVLRLEGTRLLYMYFNLDKAPTNDVRVRRALNLAVDRQAIMKRVALGAAAPAESVMERIISYSTPVGKLEYKVDEARELLRQAGVAGQTLRMVAPEGVWEFDRQTAEAVAGYLRTAGVKVDLEIIKDMGAYTKTLGTREHHLGMVGWAGSTGDPDHYLRRQLWGQNAGKPWNFSGYKNPKVDELIAVGARTFDTRERARIYADVQRTVWNDYPWLILHRVTGFAVARAPIEGIEIYLNSQAHVFLNARAKGN
jgi:peptide/nickel transport system substrate-binding protein